MRQYKIFHTPEELGRLARSGRESQKLGLRAAAPQANVGPRFLSEFERGKPTAEFAKVLSAVHAAGLDLAVVKRPATKATHPGKTSSFSKLLNTEFPYDWSNSQMSEKVFICKVLKAGRFNDVLKTVAWFGFDGVSNELPCLEDAATCERIISMLLRIQKGMLLACYQKPLSR
ncbi:hypothetical protein MNBD_GAMMA10-2082 [hydrothermal vent metagenome]|uniref:HTH cro/C1-type domain-containing protein n=1 Tax=hydrothermal vent metagenome TaxID=652676 RepID=A0A3B0XK15_9ZZZZ